MTSEEKFKDWLAKRVSPPPTVRAWSDSDLHAAFTEGYLAGARLMHRPIEETEDDFAL